MVLKSGVVKKIHGLRHTRATGNGETSAVIAGVNYGAIENCRFDGDILGAGRVAALSG